MASTITGHIIEPRITTVSSIRDNHGEKIGYRAMCYSCIYRDEFRADQHEFAVNAVITHRCRNPRKVEITETKTSRKVHHSNLRSGRYGQQTR